MFNNKIVATVGAASSAACSLRNEAVDAHLESLHLRGHLLVRLGGHHLLEALEDDLLRIDVFLRLDQQVGEGEVAVEEGGIGGDRLAQLCLRLRPVHGGRQMGQVGLDGSFLLLGERAQRQLEAALHEQHHRVFRAEANADSEGAQEAEEGQLAGGHCLPEVAAEVVGVHSDHFLGEGQRLSGLSLHRRRVSLVEAQGVGSLGEARENLHVLRRLLGRMGHLLVQLLVGGSRRVDCGTGDAGVAGGRLGSQGGHLGVPADQVDHRLAKGRRRLRWLRLATAAGAGAARLAVRLACSFFSGGSKGEEKR
ncbi:hypothetical protein TYRP_008792 [Tyrophagus putrescentiae]|nr:hypothetical protein TYRP_008792 [Tyrophagus putrescentiae]